MGLKAAHVNTVGAEPITMVVDVATGTEDSANDKNGGRYAFANSAPDATILNATDKENNALLNLTTTTN